MSDEKGKTVDNRAREAASEGILIATKAIERIDHHTEMCKTLQEDNKAANSRIHSRLDKILYGVVILAIGVILNTGLQSLGMY